MKLESITVENYRQFEKAELTFDEGITILAGANNSGKTSLINLIKNIFVDDKLNYNMSDIPAKNMREWVEWVYPIFQKFFRDRKTEENVEKDLLNVVIPKEETDSTHLMKMTTVKIHVSYNPDMDDIKLFADCIMDLDETKHDFYFMYNFEIVHTQFAREIINNFSKIKHRFAEIEEKKSQYAETTDELIINNIQVKERYLKQLRFLHVEAIGAIDAEAFMERIDVPVFSNNDNQKMLAAIKECISLAKGCEPTNEEVWKFCKAFILLLFDMDCAESVNCALSASLIKCNSPENPILVWSRLVEYAGQCNQAAASVSKENIDRNIRDLFSKNNIIQLPPDPITAIDLFIPTIALIGAWKEDNEFDRKMIEQISGMEYSEFEAKARTMLSQNSEYLQLMNGNWKVCHKEELLNQCKNKLFDDSIGKLLEAVESILRQKSKCVASKMPYFIPISGEYDNSLELRGNLVKSLCWVKKNLSELSQCNQEKIENNIYTLVSTLLQDAKWITWTSLRDCLQNLAELSPEAFLKEAERGIINNPTEIVNLFPPKSGELSGINYISNLLWALEILAWSPEYLVHSISCAVLAKYPWMSFIGILTLQ